MVLDVGGVELRTLRRTLRDVVAVSTLPAMWIHQNPSQVADSLAEALYRVIQLDFAFVSVLGRAHHKPIETAYGKNGFLKASDVAQLWINLRPSVHEKYHTQFVEANINGEKLRIAVIVNNLASQNFCVIAGSSRSGFPSDEERLVLNVALNQAAVTLERKLANEVLKSIIDVGQVISAELNLDELIQKVTDAATKLSGAEFGAFFYNVTDEKGDYYTLCTLSGASRDDFSKFPLPRKTHILGPTFEGAEIVRSNDITKDPRYGKNAPYHGMPRGHLPVVSYLAVPVVSRSGEILGGLFFGHSKQSVFSQNEEDLVKGLSSQAAIAIDNARLYQRSNEATQVRDEFLSIVSHELKTPITSLKLQLQMSQRDVDKNIVPPASKLSRTFNISTRQVARLEGLVEDLLDVANFRSGKLTLRQEEVELASLVREIIDRMVLAIKEANSAVTLSLDEKIIGFWDRARIEQVVLNLLSNAIKYAPGKTIEISTFQNSEGICLSVTDNGPGIDQEKQSAIFERFERAASNNIAGLGLGLFIVKQIVEGHQGTVQVKSKLGAGTTFFVNLPINPSISLAPDSSTASKPTREEAFSNG